MKKKKKFEIKKYIGFIFSMFLGIIFGLLIGIFLLDTNTETVWYEDLLYPVFLTAVISVSFIIQTIIHEAGHLVFGLLTGYKFSSFRIFSLILVKENKKLKFKNLSLAGTSGQCLMLPPEMINGSIPVVLYNLGGSLMNIIASAVFAGVYFLCSDIQYLSVTLLLLVMTGILIALLNGIPMCMGAVNNDGYNAISLTKNSDAMKSFWTQLKIVEQTAKGIRIKDMPDDWFALPTDKAMKNSMVATQGVFVCNRLMDAQNFDEADKLMRHMLEIETGIVGLHRNMLICDRLYIELIKDNREEIIKKMYTKELKSFIKSMKNYPTIIRTQYALALLFENDVNKAEGIKRHFNKRSKSYPYPKEIEAERDLMRIAERIYDDNRQISKTI